MIIIFTGNGKGKTTAALGQALRAIGNGGSVLMVQFIKGPWISGEHKSALKLKPNFRIERMGKGFVGIGNDSLPFDTHVTAAEKGIAFARRQIRKGRWKILILDEIWNALHLGLLPAESVSNFIKMAKPRIDHLIMTGRNCPQEFIDGADIVTEMKEIKHPFKNGVRGRASVEY